MVSSEWRNFLSYEKESGLPDSRAEARLLQQPSAIAPSAHPRGAFLYDRTQFPIIQKTGGITTARHHITD